MRNEPTILVDCFLKSTNANEISETIFRMLDAYLLSADTIDPIARANAVNLSFKLSQLIFNLENLQPKETQNVPPLETERSQCLHN